jgi:FkbM family methyltransferase
LTAPFHKLHSFIEAYLPYIGNSYYYVREYGHVKSAKGLGFLSYKMFRTLLLDLSKEHIVEVNKLQFNTIPNDLGISTELLVFRVHEPLSTQLLTKELSVGDVCLDIGANIGYYALLERKIVQREGRVVAIEPIPQNFFFLKKNISLNALYDIEALRLAISDKDCEVSMVLDQRSNLCRVTDSDTFSATRNIIKVRAQCLDNFVKDHGLTKLDFVRMDTEGSELLIYTGGRTTFRRLKPELFVEIHKRSLGLRRLTQFLLLLKKDGYEVKYFIPRELNTPWVGDHEDVQEPSLDELVLKVLKGRIVDAFHLFLVNKS